MTANSDVQTRDPRARGEKPPFRLEKQQDPPGLETEMRHRPDHGEDTYRGSRRLAGRKALITGADSGIGRAVAIAFAREGADVLVSYLSEDEDAAETARYVRDAGRKAVTVRGDIQDLRTCESLVERAFGELGGLDILVNNAAFQSVHEKIEETSPEEWDRTFRTNIYAMFYLCRAALPRMPAGGAILNVASVNAYMPNPTLLAYATTKGAIVTFTKALSGLAIQKGVRVNALAPGPVWTPLIPSTMEPERVRSFGKDNPNERPAQPAEMAPAFVFLASDESRFVNGSVIDLTGGEMLP